MFMEAPELAAYGNLRHAFFTRQGGVSGGVYASLNGGLGSNDERERVLENRRRMAAQLDVEPQALVSVYQIHSPDAVIVEGPWPGEKPKADGMATATPGVALAITTADCGPVLLADPEASVIGAAHAGWRGALGGVLESTIAAMERLGARRERTVAVLGPTIGADAYEVGTELIGQFTQADPANERFFRANGRPGHAQFDLPAYIAARLQGAGIGQVADLGLCTYSDEERFFSFRRATHRGEPDYGRLIAAIAIADQGFAAPA
jgi:YfiH family protein